MINHFRGTILLLCVLFATVSCQDDAPENCAGILCPFVGNWQLSKVTLDGSLSNGEHSGYGLNLMLPVGENTSADYTRNFGNGVTESGTWTVTNNNDVIVLSTDGEEEEYIVEEVGEGSLVLVLHRESFKPGAGEIRYVFVK